MNKKSTVLSILFGLLLINYFVNSSLISLLTIIICGLSLISNKFSFYIDVFWNKLSFILSKIVPKIILFIVYFLILTPFSILSKIFGAQTNFRSINNSDTFFVNVNKSFNDKSFKKTW